LTVTARSVRRKIRSGRGDARQSNKEMTGHDGLDTNRPIQVLGRISAPTMVASGRTGVRAKAALQLRARNRLPRPKAKFLAQERGVAGVAAVPWIIADGPIRIAATR
jgi:hypothetical protein